MTSTSKSGMVVTSNIHVAESARDAEPLRTEEVPWATVLKGSVAFALIIGGSLFVLWALMKGALWLIH